MRKHSQLGDRRIRIVSACFILFAAAIIARLFYLQVIQHEYYSALALDTHEIYKKLYPRRGSIYFQDARSGELHPAAINRAYYLVYAVPREIPADQIVSTTDKLAELLHIEGEEKNLLQQKLSKKDDPYEPVAKKVAEEAVNGIKQSGILGVYYASQEHRYYPEGASGAHILGFIGSDEKGAVSGRYGIEGYWENTLRGKGGYLSGERGAGGSWISLASRTLQSAEDGADIVLTIDRSLQSMACERLRRGFLEYKARSAALVILDPATGAIRAMCSMPDFDPNNYAKVKDVRAYNNNAIFLPYEPGSVFKPLTMAAALDLNLVSPDTVFEDPGSRHIDGFTIHNAMNRSYGKITMTQVLENSVNTGMIWVQEKIGRQRFKEYVERFGFGEKTGIALDTEVAGDVSSLSKSGRIYGAVGAFGQGLTATVLQMAAAFGALANNGEYMKPYAVDEVRYSNGRIERAEPKMVNAVVAPRADKLITGMMVSVVERGHGALAKLPNYYVAGKTGTAQIPGRGGYTDETNHTFVGFAPAGNPKVVLVVRYEAPERQWAESTAAPVFKDVMEFTLEYYGVKGDKN